MLKLSEQHKLSELIRVGWQINRVDCSKYMDKNDKDNSIHNSWWVLINTPEQVNITTLDSENKELAMALGDSEYFIKVAFEEFKNTAWEDAIKSQIIVDGILNAFAENCYDFYGICINEGLDEVIDNAWYQYRKELKEDEV